MSNNEDELLEFIFTLSNQIPKRVWEKCYIYNMKTREDLQFTEYFKKNMKELFNVEVDDLPYDKK